MKCIGLTALFLLSISTVHSRQKFEDAQPSYRHDSRGLEKQLEPALQAYTAGKLSGVDKQFNQFVLPDAPEWFAQYFPQDRVQELAKRQAKAEDDWETGITALMSLFPKGAQFRVHCTPSQTKSPQETKTSNGTVLRSSPPPIETYLIESSANKTSALGLQRFASVAVLVFSKRAYRFVGDEDGPFRSAHPKQDSKTR